MLFAVSGLIGCSVEASDGAVGAIKDFLFDAENWKIRWMEVEPGERLMGRRVLIHPSSIEPLDVSAPRGGLPMLSFQHTPSVSLWLTKEKIEAAPAPPEQAPVTREIESQLCAYYGFDPDWADADGAAAGDSGDRRLVSAVSVKGCHVHATDGDFGHVENLLADDVKWDIRYLVIATRNWLPGRHVVLAPHAVTGVETGKGRVDVNVTEEQVKSSPEWDPLTIADEVAEASFHRHFGWPGHGQ